MYVCMYAFYFALIICRTVKLKNCLVCQVCPLKHFVKGVVCIGQFYVDNFWLRRLCVGIPDISVLVKQHLISLFAI